MAKSAHRRKRAVAIACAAASAAAALVAGDAHAGVMIDLRTLGGTGGAVITGGGKNVSVTSGNLFTLTIGVFARVSGTNAVQQVGDFGGGGGDDTRNDDMLKTFAGSFQSVGGLLGDLTLGAAGAQVTPNPRTTPFGASGSTNGLAQDWDSDGDLDIGTTGTDPTNMWVVRASDEVHATVFGPTAVNVPPGSKGWSDHSGSFGLNANDTIIDATTAEMQLGSLRFKSSGAGGTMTAINFVPRPVTDAGGGLWFEDGVATGKTPGTGSLTLGAPVVIGIPEPSSPGLLAAAGGALAAFSRRKIRLLPPRRWR